MKRQIRKQKFARRATGSSILELGPALFILFLLLFFPLVDLMTLAVDYASAYTLNNLQLREAANLPRSQAQDPSGIVKQRIPDEWRHCGLGAFVNVTAAPATNVDYLSGETDTTGSQDMYVLVTTTLTAHPFLTLPFMVPVPGLSAPMTLSITTRRLLENPHFADWKYV